MTNVFTTISNSSYFMDQFKHAHVKDYVNVAGHVVIKLKLLTYMELEIHSRCNVNNY